MEEESKFRVTDYEDENRGRREKEATTNDQDLPSVMNLITVHNDEAKGGATMAVTAAEVMWIPSRNNCTTDTLYSLDLQRRCYSPVRRSSLC